MYDEIEISEEQCPKCKNYLVWQKCFVIDCEDGYIEDDDPFWQTEIQVCDECKGKGIITWCRVCGWNCN